jgi:hypothetical protein
VQDGDTGLTRREQTRTFGMYALLGTGSALVLDKAKERYA